MSKRKEQEAMDYLRKQGYFVQNLWQVDDVHSICKQENYPKLSDKEIIEFFDFVGNKFDPEIGITWMILRDYLEMFVNEIKV